MSFAKSQRFSNSARSEKDKVNSGGPRKLLGNRKLREDTRKEASLSKSVVKACANGNSKSNKYRRNHKHHSSENGIQSSENETQSSENGTPEFINDEQLIFDETLFESLGRWDEFEDELKMITKECLNLDDTLKKYSDVSNKELFTEVPTSDGLYLQMKNEVDLSIQNASTKIKKLFEETVLIMEQGTEKKLQSIVRTLNKNNGKLLKEAQNKCQLEIDQLNKIVVDVMKKLNSKEEAYVHATEKPIIFEDKVTDSLVWDDSNLELSLLSEEYSEKQELSEEISKQSLQNQIVAKTQSMLSVIFSKIPAPIHNGYEKIKDMCEKSNFEWGTIKDTLKGVYEEIYEFLEFFSVEEIYAMEETNNNIIYEDAPSDSLIWYDCVEDVSLDSEEHPMKKQEISEQNLQNQIVANGRSILQAIFSKGHVYIHNCCEKITNLCEKSIYKLRACKSALMGLSNDILEWLKSFDRTILEVQDKVIAEQSDMIETLTEIINADTMKENLCRVVGKQKKHQLECM